MHDKYWKNENISPIVFRKFFSWCDLGIIQIIYI